LLWLEALHRKAKRLRSINLAKKSFFKICVFFVYESVSFVYFSLAAKNRGFAVEAAILTG
jgi:hypothetical protein